MNIALNQFLNKAIRFIVAATVFALPLFVLPFTAEVYEFNKQFLFYVLVLIGVLLWLVKSVIARTFVIKRTLLDLPIIVLWVALLLSTILSVDRRLSFFGDFAFLDRGFLTFTFGFLFYFLVVQTYDTTKSVMRLLGTVLVAGLIASLFFIFRVLGWYDFSLLRIPGFNTVSASNTIFNFYASVIFLLSFAILLFKKTDIRGDIIAALAAIASFVCIVISGFTVVWVALAVGLFFVLVVAVSQLDKTRIPFVSLTFALFVIALLATFLNEPEFLKTRLPIEVALSPSTSWDISWATFTKSAKNFFIGSGPSTFIYDFSAHRPQYFNMNDLGWSLRFRQPYSLAFAIVAEWGVLGMLAFLFVVLMGLGVIFAGWIRRYQGGASPAEGDDYRSHLLPFGLVPAWFMLLASMFVGSSGTVLLFLFWVMLALFFVTCRRYIAALPNLMFSLKTSPQYVLASSFSVILVFTAAIVLGVYLGRFYTAEVVYAKALSVPPTLETIDQRIQKLQRAVTLNNNRVDYHLLLADAHLLKARLISQSPAADPQTIAALVVAAVNEAQNATNSAPKNVSTWELLANMYLNARTFAPQATELAIGAFKKAIEFEPTNPILHIGLGDLYQSVRRLDDAKTSYETAINLKPNLLIAYQHLAILHEGNRELQPAIATLGRALPYVRIERWNIAGARHFYEIGRLHFNVGKPDNLRAAELAFQTAVEMVPDYSDAWYGLALLAERAGRNDEARAIYEKIRASNPANKAILQDLQRVIAAPPAPAPAEPTQVQR